MKEHNFTPEQSEQILNAVHLAVSCKLNAYCFARFVNETTIDKIQASMEREGNDTPTDINITPDHLDEVLFNTRLVSDLFFKIGDAISDISQNNNNINNPNLNQKNVSDKNINEEINYGLN